MLISKGMGLKNIKSVKRLPVEELIRKVKIKNKHGVFLQR
jgi:hypothetical protein